MRTRHGPANSSAITNVALAIILCASFAWAPDALRTCAARPRAVLDAVMT